MNRKIQTALYIIALCILIWCMIVGAIQSIFYAGVTDNTFWVAVTSVIAMLILRWSWADE